MAFQPYQIYKSELPRLKPGHFINIGSKFYEVTAVRNNRQPFDFATATEVILNSSTSSIYEAMHGAVDMGRIVHLHYVAVINEAPDVLLKWGTEPLLSKWRNIQIDSNSANRQTPLVIDRWSYDKEMRISVTPAAAAAQTLWFENVEYEVEVWEKTPPKRYLKILANGHAVFMEAG